MGLWNKNHEEAVYNTRVHSIFGYGIAEFEAGHFGGQSAIMQYSENDIRFSKSKDGNTLYVYILGIPESNKELGLKHIFESNLGQQISTVRLLGNETQLQWEINKDMLLLQHLIYLR